VAVNRSFQPDYDTRYDEYMERALENVDSDPDSSTGTITALRSRIQSPADIAKAFVACGLVHPDLFDFESLHPPLKYIMLHTVRFGHCRCYKSGSCRALYSDNCDRGAWEIEFQDLLRISYSELPETRGFCSGFLPPFGRFIQSIRGGTLLRAWRSVGGGRHGTVDIASGLLNYQAVLWRRC
jgi:hypothetical protein